LQQATTTLLFSSTLAFATKATFKNLNKVKILAWSFIMCCHGKLSLMEPKVKGNGCIFNIINAN